MLEGWKSDLIAVYGTLRKGCSNHAYIADAEYLGDTFIHRYKMYSLGAFPALVPAIHSDPNRIKVEVNRVDAEQAKAVDTLAGYPVFYDRCLVDTKYGLAWIYFLSNPPTRTEIIGGDWVEDQLSLQISA